MNDAIYKSNKSVPAAKMEQLSYTEKAKARKAMELLVMPDKVIADASLAGQLVGKGNLLRVKGVAGGLIAFGASNMVAPASTDQTSMETPAEFFMVIATDDYVRTSAAMRIEVCND